MKGRPAINDHAMTAAERKRRSRELKKNVTKEKDVTEIEQRVTKFSIEVDEAIFPLIERIIQLHNAGDLETLKYVFNAAEGKTAMQNLVEFLKPYR
jgi:hypothetical protein